MLKPPALVREDRQSLTEVWGRKEVWARPSLATLCRAGIRRKCAGLSPCLSAPHTARTWQWGEAWPSIISMRRRAECCPSSDTGHPSLLPTAFYVFFIYLFIFCCRQHRGATRDLQLGAPLNRLGILFFQAAPPTPRAALIIFSYHLKLIFSSAAFMAVWLKGLSLSVAAQLCSSRPRQRKSFCPPIKEPWCVCVFTLTFKDKNTCFAFFWGICF